MEMTLSNVPAGAIIAELSHRALLEGGNTGVWPGLTIYRFTSPTGPSWEEIQSLSLCIVAQGRKAVTVDGTTYKYDPFHYLVLNSHLHFQAEILEATPGKPFLSFVLQIDPSVVRQVSSDMLERRTTAFRQLLVQCRHERGRLRTRSWRARCCASCAPSRPARTVGCWPPC